MAHEDEERSADQSGAGARSGVRSEKDERAQRLAAALRENLRRRKMQARGRRADAQDKIAPGEKPDDTII